MSGTVLQPGRAVGDYVVEAYIAESGLDRAYLATAPDGRRATVKVPRFEPGTNEEFLRRFHRQAEMASRVSAPNVAAVIGSGVLDVGIPYIVEEYLPGGSLEAALLRGRMPIDHAVRVTGEVAAGLDALHAARIIHRYLTPACILFDGVGNARVSGFGLAKDQDASQLTRAGHAVGAAEYMSPEQIRGQQVSPATDIYALGCVVFEMLTGAPPFATHKGMKVLWAHMQEPPPDPRRARPDIPVDLVWPLQRALAKEPAERPSSATTFARLVQISWEGARPR